MSKTASKVRKNVLQPEIVEEAGTIAVEPPADNFASWLARYGVKAAIFAAVLLVLSFIVVNTTQNAAASAESDYRRASSLFAELSQNPTDENIAAFKDLLARRKELASRYEADFAQVLLVARASDPLPTTASRVAISSDQAALYKDFSATSLAIAAGKKQEALDQAASLQSKLSTGDDVLRVYNLLRLANLNKQVGNKAAEKAALEQLLAASQPAASKEARSTFNSVGQSFFASADGFSDYIKARLQLLTVQ